MIGIIAGTNLLFDPRSDSGARATTFPPVAREIEIGVVTAAVNELTEDGRTRRFPFRRRRCRWRFNSGLSRGGLLLARGLSRYGHALP